MPTLTHNGRRYEFHGGFDDRLIAKDAGFHWDTMRRTWYTDDPAKARTIRQHADKFATAALDALDASVAASRRAAPSKALSVPCPAGLSYEPYQLAAVEFFRGKNKALFADQMGLGKTIETIGVINDQHPESVLVVCPASLKLNWEAELAKWLVHPYDIEVMEGGKARVRHRPGLIAIVNYDIMIKPDVLASVSAGRWGLYVIDEVHKVKEPRTKRTQACLKHIAAAKTIFLTGTPIPNQVGDIQTVLGYLEPKLFGNRMKFLYHYSNAYDTGFGTAFRGGRNLEELNHLLRSTCMIRRLKSEVLTSLPPKRRQIIAVEPSGVRGLERAVTASRNWGIDSAGRPGVPFESTSAYRKELAVAKIPVAIQTIEDMFAGGVDKLVVFAHHREVLHQIFHHFDGAKVKAEDRVGTVLIDGKATSSDRAAAVNAFNTDPKVKLFLGQHIAAGVGLNLHHSGCTDVLFVELAWNPGDVEQCEDRVHRRGVTGPVLIRYLVWREAFEEHMAKYLRDKADVIHRALDEKIS